MKRREIDQSQYPMVLNWSGYKNTCDSKLPCTCQGCGETVFKTINKLDQQKSCYCVKCGHSIKAKTTSIRRYGVERPSQDKEIKEKIKKSHQTINESGKRKEIVNQTENTNIKKYGVKTTLLINDVHEKGVEIARSSVSKRNLTKRKNQTFNTSKPENECYNLLCRRYGKENVKRNWSKDERYPFPVDFYIFSDDLFIECNFHSFFHGKEPFDNTNDKHLKILHMWQEKNNRIYNIAINTWTVRDPLKIKTALDNNLNYFVPYTMTEFLLWYNKKDE